MNFFIQASKILPKQWLQSALLHGVLLLCAVLYHVHSQGFLYLSANSLGQIPSSAKTIGSQLDTDYLELSFEHYDMTEPQQADAKLAEGSEEVPREVAREALNEVPVEVPSKVSKDEPVAASKERLPVRTKSTTTEVLTANAPQSEAAKKRAETEVVRTKPAAQHVGPAHSSRTSVQSTARSAAVRPRDSTQPLQTARPDHAYSPKPTYPLALRDLGVSGVVWLRVWVDDTGRPREIELSKGSGYRLFDEAALRAVQHWRFIPAKSEQQNLASWVEFAVRFELNG
jgi:TonB family protein